MKKILNGNEAFAYGALHAGVDFYAGYPITPSTDVYEFFEKYHENMMLNLYMRLLKFQL